MENNKESVLAKGFYFDRPREGAPEFVKGRMSIMVDAAIDFLKEHKGESGYVNLDLLNSREGKLYLKLNTFQPKPKDEEIKPEDLPAF